MSESHQPTGSLLRWLLSFGVGGAAILVLRLWRGFFWAHAILIGLAIAALVFNAWRTWENARRA